MGIFNKRDAYGWMAITLHWLLFFLAAGLIASGKYSASLSSLDKNVIVIGLHKQFGLAVFLLMMFRMLWRLINDTPLPADNAGLIVRMLTFITHWLLYVVVLSQVAIGVAMSHLAERNVSFFGLFRVPEFTALSESFLEALGGFMPFLFSADSPAMQMRELHYWGALIIMVLVGLHAAAALVHHFIFGDDTLRRMFFGYAPAYAKYAKRTKP